MSVQVIIWDSEEDCSYKEGNIIYWSKYSLDEKNISMPKYIEDNADSLREEYIEFIHLLSQAKIKNKKVIEHLIYEDGFSFWWMNHLAEKSPFKSSGIYDCIRLIALGRIIDEKGFLKIKLITSNYDLIQAITKMADHLKIVISIKKLSKKKKQISINNLYQSIPYAIQGLISLRHSVKKCFTLHAKKNRQLTSEDKNIFYCSYFYNIDFSKAKSGQFYSGQWGELPTFINKMGFNSNWMHLYLNIDSNPSFKEGIKVLEKCNKQNQHHQFIESFLTLGLIFLTFKKWLWFNYIAFNIRSIKNLFVTKNKSVWLWPFLKDDWKTSMVGPISIFNIISYELFNRALKNMPKQDIGIYVWENQGWESAFVYTWKKHNHGRLYGMQHAAVRFWGLNNFDHSNDIESSRKNSKPMPTAIAVNGCFSRSQFEGLGYPSDKLKSVEAVRYQYLESYESLAEAKNKISVAADKQKVILLLGDFSFSHTEKMLECLNASAPSFKEKFKIWFKPHPLCIPDIKQFENLDITLCKQPLTELFIRVDIAYIGNMTSASLDAYIVGLPVLIFLDGDNFNFSPLKSYSDVLFVGSTKELVKAVNEAELKSRRIDYKSIFYLDKNFSKWKKLLEARA